MQPMQRKVALVSGGSRGIGRAIVNRLAADGFNVGFCYNSDSAAADQVCAEATACGASVVCQQTDVRDLGAVRRLVAATEDELGPLDVVVANAGIVRDNPMVLMTPEQWTEVRSVNLDGTFHLCRAAVFSMMKRKTGCIVTLSSVVGLNGNATQSNYAATKAGIIGMTCSLARELGGYGIRANVVAPGMIDTEMTAGLSEAVRKRIVAQIPLGRLGAADEVADLVGYLASERASYITGQVFRIDGGIAM